MCSILSNGDRDGKKSYVRVRLNRFGKYGYLKKRQNKIETIKKTEKGTSPLRLLCTNLGCYVDRKRGPKSLLCHQTDTDLHGNLPQMKSKCRLYRLVLRGRPHVS